MCPFVQRAKVHAEPRVCVLLRDDYHRQTIIAVARTDYIGSEHPLHLFRGYLLLFRGVAVLGNPHRCFVLQPNGVLYCDCRSYRPFFLEQFVEFKARRLPMQMDSLPLLTSYVYASSLDVDHRLMFDEPR